MTTAEAKADALRNIEENQAASARRPLAAVAARVERRAEPIRVGRALLTLLAALFFALGWFVGMVFRGSALALGWAVTAARIGFGDGRGRVHDGDG